MPYHPNHLQKLSISYVSCRLYYGKYCRSYCTALAEQAFFCFSTMNDHLKSHRADTLTCFLCKYYIRPNVYASKVGRYLHSSQSAPFLFKFFLFSCLNFEYPETATWSALERRTELLWSRMRILNSRNAQCKNFRFRSWSSLLSPSENQWDANFCAKRNDCCWNAAIH